MALIVQNEFRFTISYKNSIICVVFTDSRINIPLKPFPCFVTPNQHYGKKLRKYQTHYILWNALNTKDIWAFWMKQIMWNIIQYVGSNPTLKSNERQKTRGPNKICFSATTPLKVDRGLLFNLFFHCKLFLGILIWKKGRFIEITNLRSTPISDI